MSEPTASPPEPAAEPPTEPPIQPPPVEPAARRSRLFPWLTATGFVVVAAALYWIWQYPTIPVPRSEQTEALTQQLGALEARVSRLEQRPFPQLPDLGPLNTRIAALEQRPAPPSAAPASPAPDLAPLQARLTALEQRPPPNLTPLETRIAALEARQTVESQLAARTAALENSQGQMRDDLTRRISASDLASRHSTQVQAAALALAAGRKLGALPGAPAPLARFADAKPPTEAALRVEYPPAARAALAAARPSTEGQPLLTRLWAQAQDLVTIRQGDHLLVGDPAATALERARVALDAGDLATATTEVATLQGAAAQAMAGWLAQARALLEARAALAAWAASD